MTVQSKVTFRIATDNDFSDIVYFFDSIREELYLQTTEDVTLMCRNFFDHGGAMVGCIEGKIIAAVGYFLGDPSNGFMNKDIGFVYVAGLAKAYRHSGVFRVGLAKTIQHFIRLGLTEVRLHALKTDKRLNGIYSSFMESRELQENMRGLPCYLYRASVDHIMQAAANRPKTNPQRYAPTPTGMPANPQQASI